MKILQGWVLVIFMWCLCKAPVYFYKQFPEGHFLHLKNVAISRPVLSGIAFVFILTICLFALKYFFSYMKWMGNSFLGAATKNYWIVFIFFRFIYALFFQDYLQFMYATLICGLLAVVFSCSQLLFSILEWLFLLRLELVLSTVFNIYLSFVIAFYRLTENWIPIFFYYCTFFYIFIAVV